MARERSPNRGKAKEMYLNSKGEMKLKDIAEALGVLDTQIRKWKSTDKWEQELKGTLPKDNKIKSNVTNNRIIKEKKKKEPKLQEVEEIINNSELNDKQRLFCIYYIKYFNATKAYQKVYECDYSTAMVNGCNLLRNTKVKDEIIRLKSEKFKGAMLEPGDILQKYIDIAFADITDFVVFGQEEVPVMGAFGPVLDEEGNQLTKMINTVKFRTWTNVDGTLISEIGQGKDGAKLKLYDKMKALEWLANHMDLLDTHTKEKLDIEKKKLVIAKEKLELDKSKVMENDDETGDDGFIEALKGQISEVWSNE